MQKTPFIWFNGSLTPWEDVKIHALNHSLHYGSGVFEGERFYQSGENEAAIFRLEDHTARLFYSANCLEMKMNYTPKEVEKATIETIASTGLTSGYIRPFSFYGEKMGLNPSGSEVNTLIAAWGWGKYLSDKPLSVKISQYIRIHPQSTIADAKISGHYVNSILASLEIKKQGYDEGLLLDFEGNIAEGPGENLFMVKNGVLFTPKTGKILQGITRDTVIVLAKDLGIEVVEKILTPDDLFVADELFFTGTAAEVSAIGFLDDRTIGTGETAGQEGPICKRLREKYFDVITGNDEKYEHWLTRVAIQK